MPWRKRDREGKRPETEDRNNLFGGMVWLGEPQVTSKRHIPHDNDANISIQCDTTRRTSPVHLSVADGLNSLFGGMALSRMNPWYLPKRTFVVETRNSTGGSDPHLTPGPQGLLRSEHSWDSGNGCPRLGFPDLMALLSRSQETPTCRSLKAEVLTGSMPRDTLRRASHHLSGDDTF
ncbi:hypothetical protein DL98DRAFT_533775 [Cadophora sp. DSE1049]|nr:hypothetical protein DL98DRAFT_533775 [Cadophora sp. DSE1049]